MEGSESKHSANLRTAVSPIFNYIFQQSSNLTIRCLSIFMLVLRRWIFRLAFSLRLHCDRVPCCLRADLNSDREQVCLRNLTVNLIVFRVTLNFQVSWVDLMLPQKKTPLTGKQWHRCDDYDPQRQSQCPFSHCTTVGGIHVKMTWRCANNCWLSAEQISPDI